MNLSGKVSYTNMKNIDLSEDGSTKTAHAIGLNQTFAGVLTSTEKSDYYKLTVTTPGILTSKIKPEIGEYNSMNIELYNASADEIVIGSMYCYGGKYTEYIVNELNNCVLFR